MRICCFGDSITYGEFVPRRQTWVEKLSHMLPHDVTNRGVCGETSRQALERAARDIGRDVPDVLLIQFGLNDMNRWESEHGLRRVLPFAYETNLREIAERSVDWGVLRDQIWILGPTTTTRPGMDRAGEYVKAADFAAHMCRVGFVNCEQVGCEPGDLLDDGVHLSAQGHDAYLENLCDHVAIDMVAA